MANDEGGEKTEEPTSHKLDQARKKGQVPKSMEISSSFVLVGAGITLVALAPAGWERSVAMFHHFIWRMTEIDITTADLWPWLYTAMLEILIMIMPIAIIIMILGVMSNVYQTGGFMVSSEAVNFKLDKLNFIKGFGRFFKLKSLVELIKSILKLVIIGIITYMVLADNMPALVTLGAMEPAEAGLFTLKVALEVFFKIVIVLTILAVMDFAYQKWQFNKDMRMSKQEIKDEFKQMDGDPQVKARIRQLQRENAHKRSLADVPRADVVLTNPTHFAIALVYNSQLAPAPLVLAKGQDFMAQRIKDVAKEHKVPIVENKPLAQALYKAVEVGNTIPLEFYKAVADVLSYVYRLKGKVPGGRRK